MSDWHGRRVALSTTDSQATSFFTKDGDRQKLSYFWNVNRELQVLGGQ